MIFFVILLPILYFYVTHDPNFFTNVSAKWSRFFLISSTCVQNDFWRFCDAIKQKIEHLRSKNLQNWVFTFWKWLFLSFCFQVCISSFRMIQIIWSIYCRQKQNSCVTNIYVTIRGFFSICLNIFISVCRTILIFLLARC